MYKLVKDGKVIAENIELLEDKTIVRDTYKKRKTYTYNPGDLRCVKDLPRVLKKYSPWILDSYLLDVRYGQINPVTNEFELTLRVLPKEDK